MHILRLDVVSHKFTAPAAEFFGRLHYYIYNIYNYIMINFCANINTLIEIIFKQSPFFLSLPFFVYKMTCSKIFSGELSELIDEIIQNFRNDISTLYSCIFFNRLWCRLAIPILWED